MLYVLSRIKWFFIRSVKGFQRKLGRSFKKHFRLKGKYFMRRLLPSTKEKTDKYSRGTKIFGIGLSKTGTTSLFSALQILGYRAGTFRHMKKIGLQEWIKGDFSKDYLVGFDAVTDLPISTMYRQLDERYPESKFILTQRPIEEWLSSIYRQFTAKESADTFNVQTRLMTYGFGEFNEHAFRKTFIDHEREVIDYFKDKPGRLLTISLFNGDGWEEVCEFLGREIPDQDFPHIRPGRSSVSPTKSNISNINKTEERKLSSIALIPVIAPDHPVVKDYRIIEDNLRKTTYSLLEQRNASVIVVIIGSRPPYWIDSKERRVIYIDISEVKILDGQLPVYGDKAIKMLIGYLTVKSFFKTKLIYTVDADDFLHIDSFHYLESREEKSSNGKDGYIWTQGLNVEVYTLSDGTIEMGKPYIVSEFNKTCGTCRAFKSDKLNKKFTEILPYYSGLKSLLERDASVSSLPIVRISKLSSQFIWDQIKSFPISEDNLMGILGRHVKQETSFDLEYLPIIGAAKSCGHGQHHGPKKGAVHHSKVYKQVSREEFLSSFGLLSKFDDNDIIPIVETTD